MSGELPMLDSMNLLVNKLSLRICRSEHPEHQTAIFDTVKYVLCKQICESFSMPIDWNSFNRGGKFRSSDGYASAQIASLTSEIRKLWAIKILARDTEVARRQWIFHFGIRVFDDNHLYLCYAKCCYDHTAGSVQNPRAVPLTLDRLPDPLFFNDDIQCMCGETPLPIEPVELENEALPEFVDLLMDPQRACPILLISCIDALAPEEAADVLLDNAAVYWCTDAAVMMRLNALLPEELSTPWDSVRAFLPMGATKSYHPCWAYEDIRRIGEEHFLRGLRQAYCASMRSQERRDFITVDDVCRYRDQVHIHDLSNQLEKQKAASSRLLSQAEKQNVEVANLRGQLQALRQSTDAKLLKEYESLLNETMAEADTLKKAISTLSERLYSTLGAGFTPDEAEPVALIQELSQAIYAVLARVGASKR